MKKFLVLVFPILLFSCSVEEEICINPTFVQEPPSEESWNSKKAYVEAKDLQTIKYVGNFCTDVSTFYELEEGKASVDHHFFYEDIYQINASRYWNWHDGKEYASAFKEGYEISATVLSSIKDRVEDANFAICSRRVISGSDDHVGLGLEIYGVDF